ncbi:MAG TPA: hypothetical protein VI462_18245 [Acidimicrobiia bacterium]|jgi:hypothetical protein
MIAVYINPDSMTKAQYDQIAAKVMAGGPPPAELKHHSCFGEEPKLMIYDVWESQAVWDGFWQRLQPLFDEAGVKDANPLTMPVVDMIQP